MRRYYNIAKTRQDCEQRLLCEFNNRFSHVVAGFSGAVAELGSLRAPDGVGERARMIAAKMTTIAQLHDALSVAPAIGDSLEDYCRSLCEAVLLISGRSDVSAEIAVADVRLSPQRELRLGQLLCELLAGAINRCPENGVVAIDLRRCGSRLLECSVRPPVRGRILADKRTIMLDDLVRSLGGRRVMGAGSGCADRIQIPI